MLRLVLAFLCAGAACMLVAGAFSSSAQAPVNFTPDPFVAQVTHAQGGRDSSAGDISANGRFVVVESDGDIATERTATRNNQDGNREIFLFDYAQRKVFQLTDTKSVLKPAGSPTPSPSPSPSPSASPSPTASPTPTPVDGGNVAIEISNNRPIISVEPLLIGGLRTYTIVFSSNAPVTPASFDGTDPGAPTNTDMNQEIWIYQLPTVPDNFVLSSGAEVAPPQDLTTGTFTRITNTPASRAPSPGTTGAVSPFIADDNRDATISDDGQKLAFISTRNFAGTAGFVGAGNPDANPEVMLFNRGTSAFTQVTSTTTTSANNPIFSSNPNLSGDGSVLAFISNANLTAQNDDGNGLSNAEIYILDGAGLRQVTKTKDGGTGATATILSYGRRLSRNGKFIAFESLAEDPSANGADADFYVSFVYDVTANTFAQLGPRATVFPGDVAHFPTFTDYDAALNPASVVFTSALNLKTDGTILEFQDTAGLNPTNALQLFLAPLPVISTGPFTRLTTTNGNPQAGLRGLASNSRQRIAFSLQGSELGGGNGDGSKEVFYQVTTTTTTESGGTLTLFTGASLIPIPVASPTATPSPTSSPTPSPSPSASPTAPEGLAPGELAIIESSVSLAPGSVTVADINASESKREPDLPIELNGVSVAIQGAACGLYSVSPTQIKFVVPIGVSPGAFSLVINNNGSITRGVVTIVAAQPDIFTSTNGPLGRAKVCNVTDPSTPIGICLGEPFNVTSDDGTGTQVPTVLRIFLTGVRNSTPTSINVTVGTTVIVPNQNFATDLPGTDNIDFTLPSTVDRGDLPIIVKVGLASSRPEDTAPHITINAVIAPYPIVNNDYFVWQQYEDFLDRPPDSSGYDFWTKEIELCGVDQRCIDIKRTNVSAAFFLSVEFQQTGYLVYRVYKAAYGDMQGAPVPLKLSEFTPDKHLVSDGVIVNQTGWEQVLENNKQDYASQVVQRTRFTDAHPTSTTPAVYVDTLFANAGVSPSTSDRDAAIAEFGGALNTIDVAARSRALLRIAENATLQQQEFNKAFVLMEYFGYLRRNPYDPPEQTLDYQGFDFWLTKLNSANGNYIKSEMVKSFLVSGEYRQRFGQ